MRHYFRVAVAIATAWGMLFAPIVAAEQNELRIAKQYGLGYLTLMVMEDQQLVEKAAKAAGFPDLKVSWNTFRSSDVMNDALLSGSVDFVCLGITGIGTIWARTRGNIDVRAVSGLNVLPLQLNTRSPNIKGINDFTEKDKIALPAVKVSMQATLLQMWAEKELGAANRNKLDPLTVSMTHPDGATAMIAGGGEINNHFTSPPFIQMELDKPGIRKVVSSNEILGGPVSFNVVATTGKFYADNPKLVAVFMQAMQTATDIINGDKRAAAETYLRLTRGKQTVDEMLQIIGAPSIEYTLQPRNVLPFVDFMYRTGSIKVKPESWKDLFFPSAHAAQGS
ncbi:MAG: ABC transporter substrate-binding protein [Betaproteobacteria bacterium]